MTRLNTDFHCLLDEHNVGARYKAALAELGLTTIGLFARLGDDLLSVREAIRGISCHPVWIDPMVSGVTPETRLERLCAQACLVDAWEAARSQADERRCIETSALASSLSPTITADDIAALRVAIDSVSNKQDIITQMLVDLSIRLGDAPPAPSWDGTTEVPVRTSPCQHRATRFAGWRQGQDGQDLEVDHQGWQRKGRQQDHRDPSRTREDPTLFGTCRRFCPLDAEPVLLKNACGVEDLLRLQQPAQWMRQRSLFEGACVQEVLRIPSLGLLPYGNVLVDCILSGNQGRRRPARPRRRHQGQVLDIARGCAAEGFPWQTFCKRRSGGGTLALLLGRRTSPFRRGTSKRQNHAGFGSGRRRQSHDCQPLSLRLHIRR